MAAAAFDDAAALPGTSRLLAQCARLASAADERPSARTRLESEVGLDLARLLIEALVSGPRRAVV